MKYQSGNIRMSEDFYFILFLEKIMKEREN